MSYASFFLLLVAYSFAGWLLEVSYCGITERRLVNRGFLYGPLCPIYGVGCVLVARFLGPLSGNLFFLFIAAAILTTALEYATSWTMEKFFSTTWWDYSKSRFNLNGRVCLENSVAFGAMSVVIVRFVHPFLLECLSLLPADAQTKAAAAIFAVGLADLTLTLRELLSLDKKIGDFKTFVDAHIHPAGDSEWFDALELKKSYARLQKLSRADTSGLYAQPLEHLERVLRSSTGMRRLFRSFSGMRNKKHDFALAEFRRLKKGGKPPSRIFQ